MDVAHYQPGTGGIWLIAGSAVTWTVTTIAQVGFDWNTIPSILLAVAALLTAFDTYCKNRSIRREKELKRHPSPIILPYNVKDEESD